MSVKILYHPKEDVMGLWRDRDFPSALVWNHPDFSGWSVWIGLTFARKRGWIVIGDL